MSTNPLTNVLPARVRAILYAVAFVLTLAFAAWQASDGNWVEFAGGLIGTLASALAHGNTPAKD